MKHYIVPRARQAEYDKMIEIHDWCETVFGKEDYVRWSVNFARGTEDYVEFGFRDEADASAFVFQWGYHCVSKEQQFKLGLCSLDEL